VKTAFQLKLEKNLGLIVNKITFIFVIIVTNCCLIKSGFYSLLHLFSVFIVFVWELKSLSKSCFGQQITEMRRHLNCDLNCWLFCQIIDGMFGDLSIDSIVSKPWVVSIEGNRVLSLLFGVLMIFHFFKKDLFLNKWSIN